MRKWIETTGRSEEDAIAAALFQLGLDRDDVSVEVLERAKSGFLGFGGNPAKVRVSYEVPDEDIPAAPEQPEPVAKPEPIVESQPEPILEPQSEPILEPQSEPQPESQAESASGQLEPGDELLIGQEEQSSPIQEEKAQDGLVLAEADDAKAARIREFLTGLMEHLHVQAVPEIYVNERGYQVVLQGHGLGAIIGRRGETLDAIQQLTNYSVNRGQSKRVRIHVDAEGYRAKREESLQRLAIKVAGKVVKYRKNMALEPMNAYERHVIHSALQDYPNVTTYSTGVEPNRRTVVAYAPDQK
ncbi:MAG: Jag N-terminal domain-containing protein [Oscillospiraceae bacterium]|jgi:spoIIIJ-associated protein|nr:Jag N-terminal domain-containing protein [Oscillospiraceae bacterium]